MKNIYYLLLTLAISSLSFGQGSIDFDTASNWTASMSGYGDYEYTDTNFLAVGTEIIKNGTSIQDGFPGANGTSSVRLKNSSTSSLTMSVTSGGIADFTFQVRRWDASPDTNFSVETTTDGSTWSLSSTIDVNLTDDSDWKTVSGTVNSANTTVGVRIVSNGTTERIMVDNFTWTAFQASDPCDGVTGAPAIADDFDGNSVDILEYAGDNDATYATVDGSPFGSTSNVLQYVDNGGQYANIQLRTCNKFDMAVTNFFTMDVYIDGSSLTGTQTNKVQFKLQDKSMGGSAWQSQVVSEVLIDAVDTWQTVEFDFAAASGRTDIDQVVIQFNGENNNDQVIAYIDNLVSSTSPEPDPCDGVTGAPAIADDFDGNSVDILEYAGDNDATYATVDGSPFGSTSNVLQYVDNGGQYANIQLRTCNKFDMAVTNFFTMDVYIDGSSLTGTQTNKVQFKLQDKSMGGSAWQSQVVSEVLIDAVDTWQTVEFDFIAASDRTDIDQVVIQFNGENNNDQVIAYIDNLVSSTSPEPDPCDGVTGAPAIADDFDGNSVDILEYAGDNDATYATVDGSPFGSTSNVLQYVDNGGQYANIQLRTCNKFDMAVTNFFTMDVYIDGSSLTGTQTNKVQFKLQDKSMGGSAWQSQVVSEVLIDAVDTWQTVEFDFIAASDRTDIDQVVIQFNGENNNDQVIAYIDNLVSSTSVVDTTAPVIELLGANPQELTVGDAYVELGATASDDTDGDISASIVTDATAVDTATAGSYSVTYNVSDAAGNPATEVVRTVTVEEATVSGPSCDHTFVMIDSYGDGWNGASVDILVNGVAVVEGAAAVNAGVTSGSTENLIFQAATGDNITLSNWQSGSFNSEISWAILDNEGTELASGSYSVAGSAVGYCIPPPTCDHTFVMIDSYGDGWNGASVDILVNGVAVVEGAAAVSAGVSSGSSEDLLFQAEEGSTITLSNWQSGSFNSEISWAILDGNGTVLDSGSHGELSEVTAYCTPPSCLDPSDLAVSDITTTTASVTWTANNGETAWEYQVVESGVAPDATGAATSDNPLALTGLTAYTAYDVYVRANCGDSVSGWVMESFTTLFQAPSCGETAEYCYANGDGGGSGFASSYTVDPLELVFTSTVDTTGDYLTLTIGGETESNYDWVYVTDGAGNVILEPVSGAMEYDVVSEDGTVNVYISADSSASCASPSSWSGEPDTPLSFTVSCNPPPSCIDPTDLSASGITTTGAVVSWVSDGTAFLIEIQPEGSLPGTPGGYVIGDVDPYPTTSVDLTGYLTPGTSYDIYVTNVCDGGNSELAGPLTFTTFCEVASGAWSNDFDTNDDCWLVSNGGDANTWVLYDDSANGGGVASYAISYDSNLAHDDYLVSPAFTVTDEATDRMSFDARNHNPSFPESIDVQIWNADINVLLETVATDVTPSTAYETFTYDLSAYEGQDIRFAFYISTTDEFRISIDNVVVDGLLGLEDVNTSSNFTYFPNPVNNVLSIKAQASIDSITVYNMLGQTVVRSTPNTTTTAVDMSGLQTGAYFVQVAINNSIETVRVIKN